MTRDYRARVRFTEKHQEELAKLVILEKDYGVKKKNPAKWYQYEVQKALKETTQQTPSLRTYEVKLDEIRDRLRIKNPLDKPWQIGSCLKYDIPSRAIPLLIEMKSTSGDSFSIRWARWVACLYDMVEVAAREMYGVDRERQFMCHALISREYANREQVSEAVDNEYPDTSDFDKLFFEYGDVSEEAIAAAMFDNIFQDEKARGSGGLTGDEMQVLEAGFGKLSKPQQEFLTEYMSIPQQVSKRLFIHENIDVFNQVKKMATERAASPSKGEK